MVTSCRWKNYSRRFGFRPGRHRRADVGVAADRNNKYYSVKDGFTLISNACSTPLYGAIVQGFEYGILGGYAISGETQGREAARIGWELLNGKKVSEFPSIPRGSRRTYFTGPRCSVGEYPWMTFLPAVSCCNQASVVSTISTNGSLDPGLFLLAQTGIIAVLIINIQHRRRVERSCEPTKKSWNKPLPNVRGSGKRAH